MLSVVMLSSVPKKRLINFIVHFCYHFEEMKHFFQKKIKKFKKTEKITFRLKLKRQRAVKLTQSSWTCLTCWEKMLTVIKLSSLLTIKDF